MMTIAKRKPKPLKASYRELLLTTLDEHTYIEEGFLLPLIVRRKYKTNRAKKSKQASVLLNLKRGLKTGEFRFLKEGGKQYWRLGDGTPVTTPTIVSPPKEKLRAEALANLLRLQKRLADCVYVELYEHYGNGWRSKIPYSISKILVMHHQRAGTNPWAGARSDIIGQANLSQLATIIAQNWSLFRNKLGDRYITIGKLYELGGYRNSLAHGHDLEDWQLEYISLSVKTLEKALNTK